jgi:hypothetical protein
MICKPEELKEMIPLYLNGRLSGFEKEELEKALMKYPELKRELMEFSEIMGIYEDIEQEMPPPSDILYARILRNIRSKGKEETFLKKGNYGTQVQEFLRALFSSPKVSWTVAAVQLVIILALVVFTPGEKIFRTLTSEYPVQGEAIRINVLFEEDAREREVRDLIRKAKANIVSGPTLDGLYVLEIKNNREIDTVIDNLTSSEIVKFAEKAL